MHAQTPAAINPNTDLDPLKLTPQQVQAANLLASGTTIEDVCSKLNLGRTTLYRRRQLPSFAAYLNQLTRQYADQALTQSTALLARSLHFLQEKLSDPSTPLKLQIQIAFRIASLYSRPSHLRLVHDLPDDPASVEERQMRDGLQVAGLPADTPLDGSDVELFRGYQHDYLQQAQAFDARFSSIPALPQRTKMEQNGNPVRHTRCYAPALAVGLGLRLSACRGATFQSVSALFCRAATTAGHPRPADSRGIRYPIFSRAHPWLAVSLLCCPACSGRRSPLPDLPGPADTSRSCSASPCWDACR